jgi:hypothetical protein
MIIIPKEKAWFGHGSYGYGDGYYYCFDYENNNHYNTYFNQCEILSDVTVNQRNEIHSFDDKPALVYKKPDNIIQKLWFKNGILERENKEKSYIIDIGRGYCVGNGFGINIKTVLNNLKNLKLWKNK